MDKLNYTLKEKEIQVVKKLFPKIKGEIIKEFKKHKLIKRKRVLKSYSVLLYAVFLYIIHKLSFQRISDKMACTNSKTYMSDTAWKKQITKAAPIFFSVALKLLNRTCKQISKDKFNFILGYSNAYALDATSISAEGKNGEVFRLHTKYSLIKNIPSEIHVTDKHTAESVKHYDIKPDSLYFADRAYGRTTQIAHIIDNKANFVFRISPAHIKLFYDEACKNKINFNSLLNKEETFSIICYFKLSHKTYRIRLIIAPIPVEKHCLIEKRVRENAMRKQYKISDTTVEFAKWVILATSLSEEIGGQEILNSYRLRWQIELFFKRMKSLLNFHKIRRSSEQYMRTVINLWIAVTALVSSVALSLSDCFDLDISDYNLFYLSATLFS